MLFTGSWPIEEVYQIQYLQLEKYMKVLYQELIQADTSKLPPLPFTRSLLPNRPDGKLLVQPQPLAPDFWCRYPFSIWWRFQ